MPPLHELPDGFLPDDYQTEESLTLPDDDGWRRRMEARFGTMDIVRVVNIDTVAFTWEYMPDDHELVVQPDTTSRSVYRKKPKSTTLAAGESRPIEGLSAYHMVEGLAKKLLQAGNVKMMSQPAVQEDYIDRIVIGVEDLVGMAERLDKFNKEEESSVEADLGLDETVEFPEVKRGRRKSK